MIQIIHSIYIQSVKYGIDENAEHSRSQTFAESLVQVEVSFDDGKKTPRGANGLSLRWQLVPPRRWFSALGPRTGKNSVLGESFHL